MLIFDRVQRVRFFYTRGEPGVHAWDIAAPPAPRTVDTKRLEGMLERAAESVLGVF